MKYDFLIVGAGFAGSVCAQQLAAAGKTILLVDKRSHIGGNAYDCYDSHGVQIHPYGPHIFHTNAKRIIEYLSAFTRWRFYEHRVLACIDGKHYPLPINRSTINELYGLELDEKGVEAYLESVREAKSEIRTSEDAVLSTVGRDLCEKFFRGYTRKQWGIDLSELSAGVAARIPTRTNDDDRYFADTYQLMPSDGYTKMFIAMLSSPNITVRTSTEFDDVKDKHEWRHLIYTGPIDAFFNYCYGKLPYRSLRFEHEHMSGIENLQRVGTINFPNDYAFTRITEFKHLTGQSCPGTSIVREYPQDEGDPYYPIPRPVNSALFDRYNKLAAEASAVTFVGRLAEYRYYNMDQVVAAALAVCKKLIAQ